jgi:hypothetical protein
MTKISFIVKNYSGKLSVKAFDCEHSAKQFVKNRKACGVPSTLFKQTIIEEEIV